MVEVVAAFQRRSEGVWYLLEHSASAPQWLSTLDVLKCDGGEAALNAWNVAAIKADKAHSALSTLASARALADKVANHAKAQEDWAKTVRRRADSLQCNATRAEEAAKRATRDAACHPEVTRVDALAVVEGAGDDEGAATLGNSAAARRSPHEPNAEWKHYVPRSGRSLRSSLTYDTNWSLYANRFNKLQIDKKRLTHVKSSFKRLVDASGADSVSEVVDALRGACVDDGGTVDDNKLTFACRKLMSRYLGWPHPDSHLCGTQKRRFSVIISNMKLCALLRPIGNPISVKLSLRPNPCRMVSAGFFLDPARTPTA